LAGALYVYLFLDDFVLLYPGVRDLDGALRIGRRHTRDEWLPSRRVTTPDAAD
jgi:hypothetical protein